jgi:hypothetical protein
MAAGGIAVTGARGLATGSGSGGEATLDHGVGNGSELFEEIIPTHLRQ